MKFSKSIMVLGTMLVSSQAMALNVLGVTWNPDSFNDWEGHTNYGQWITATNQPQSPLNVAPSISSALAINFANPATLVGNYLTGVGEFNQFNEGTTNTGSPTGGVAPSFCENCELTYVFGGIQITGFDANTGYTFSGGWVNIYSDQTPVANFLPSQVNNPNLAAAQSAINNAADGNLFLSLSIDALAFTNFNFGATTLGGTVNALFSVTGGAAATYFDTDTQTLGGSTGDISYTSSSFFSSTSPANANHKVATGTADLIGNTLPEPASLALLGLGVLGLGKYSRRKLIA